MQASCASRGRRSGLNPHRISGRKQGPWQMADDVTIKFTADVSDLQQGMQQATRAVEATTSALRGGAAQINATFPSLSQAYANDAARKITTAQTSSDTELAIARQNEQTRYDIALNGVKGQSSLVK